MWNPRVITTDAVQNFLEKGGKLDYHVNGAPKVIDLISLELQNKTICLDGTSAGSWPSKRRSTPVNSSDAERVLALYRFTLGEEKECKDLEAMLKAMGLRCIWQMSGCTSNWSVGC